MVTIKDVAREAGVSDTTVSLTFKGSSRVSEETKKRVFEAAEKLKYVPNTFARSLRAGNTNTIGFIVNDITNPFYALMFKEAELELNSMGFDMFAASSNWDISREVKLIEKMIQMRVQGAIICTCEKGSKGIKLLSSFSIPHVAVDSYPDCYQGSYIANDFYSCGKIVAEHLYEIGCRNPGIINADKSMINFSAFKKTFDAFKKFFNNKNISINERNIVNAGLTIEAGKKAFNLLKENRYDADSFFCANDLCALGFMEAAEQYGIRPGIDIGIVGIDDIDISSFSKISLTTVKQPYRLIAREAAKTIVEYISGENIIKVQKELQPELVKRNSTILFSKMNNRM